MDVVTKTSNRPTYELNAWSISFSPLCRVTFEPLTQTSAIFKIIVQLFNNFISTNVDDD